MAAGDYRILIGPDRKQRPMRRRSRFAAALVYGTGTTGVCSVIVRFEPPVRVKFVWKFGSLRLILNEFNLGVSPDTCGQGIGVCGQTA